MAATAASGGDFIVYNTQGVSALGSVQYKVKPGLLSPGAIAAGQLVKKSLGNSAGNVVTAPVAGVLFPSVGTDFIAGISESVSTETTSANGYVQVTPNAAGLIYLVVPNSAAAWDTQSEYDALVGARVKMNVATTGVQTLLATDFTYNGCTVMPLDISKYPGRVAIQLRQALNFNA